MINKIISILEAKMGKMSPKEKKSLAYALATNLAKYGKPQTPSEATPTKLSKGLEKKREKGVKSLKKSFGISEVSEALPNKYLFMTLISKEDLTKRDVDMFMRKHGHSPEELLFFANYLRRSKNISDEEDQKLTKFLSTYKEMYG